MLSPLEYQDISTLNRQDGVLRLLDIVQKAFDDDGHIVAAAYIEHARQAFLDDQDLAAE